MQTLQLRAILYICYLGIISYEELGLLGRPELNLCTKIESAIIVIGIERYRCRVRLTEPSCVQLKEHIKSAQRLEDRLTSELYTEYKLFKRLNLNKLTKYQNSSLLALEVITYS